MVHSELAALSASAAGISQKNTKRAARSGVAN